MKRVTSRENPLYRDLVRLAGSTRERRRQDASLLEGVHLCESFLLAYGQPRFTVVSDSGLEHGEVAALVHRLTVPPVVLTDALFGALSQLEHGVGIAMIVPTPRPALPERLEDDCVYLDRIQDPGNVGSILRTCAATGVTRVITSAGAAMCWSPKVLRAAMGAHFALRIHEGVEWSTLAPRVGVTVRAMVVRDGTPLYGTDLSTPGLWLLGNEGEGLSPALLGAGVQRVTIPQSAAVESLNVSIAAAVCLFEQVRQRRFA